MNPKAVMSFASYVAVCVQLYCVICHCLTLHVSAYMAIFKCVVYFYFHMSEGICFAGFPPPPFFSHVVTLHVSICVLLCCFVKTYKQQRKKQADKHTHKKQQN
jgi:lipoprotein signal peptidase